MSDEVAAGGVPEGSTGTNTEPGEIAPPAAPITWGTHKQPETPDELAEAITSASLDVQVSVLLGMLERVGDQRDALKARIDAYEGAVEAWEEMGRLIEQSSLGTAEARVAQLAAPEGVGRAIVLGAEYLRERDEARAKLHELLARDVDAVDLMNVEYGCPDCGVHHACGEIVAERDRLRAVVEIANRVVDRRDPEQWSVDHNAFAELGAALEQLDAGPIGEDT
jgi:hypothetical protein